MATVPILGQQNKTNGTYTVSPLVFSDKPLFGITPDGYPNMAWTNMQANYDLYWSYWKGWPLNQKAKDQKTPLYPAKINIIRPAVIGHASALLGQYEDQIVSFSVSDSLGVNQSTAKETARVLNMLWAINNGDALFLEQALFQQIFGGYYWKVAWMPTRKRWAIRYFPVDPRACFPVWEGDDYERIVAMDVQYEIPRPTAEARFRVDLSGSVNDVEFVPVHERWTEGEYSITVDGQVGKWADGSKMEGDNPFMDEVMGHSIVPFVYVPRIRGREFLGESIISETLIGSQTELNNNVAHLIEGMADAMHPQPVIKNRPKGTQGLHLDRRRWLDLGMGQIGGKEPEAERLETAELTEPMVNLALEQLVKLAREHSNLPDVAWGRSDASIRSALTLAFMMKPLTDVGMYYRFNAARGFKQLNYYALVVANSKKKLGTSINGVEKIIGAPVTEDMVEAVLLSHKTNFPSMLPDDRTELVNEIVQRLSTGPTISIESAVRRLDGGDELKEELARIEADRVKAQEQQMELAEKQGEMAMDQADHKAELDGERDAAKSKLKIQEQKAKPKDRTTRAQAAGGRAKGEGK